VVTKIRNGKRRGKRVRIGAPDSSLTAVAGLVAVRELVDRLGVVECLDAAVGPIKVRARGCSAGQLLVGITAAQLAGEDFLVGLDRQRADAAGVAGGHEADDAGAGGGAVPSPVTRPGTGLVTGAVVTGPKTKMSIATVAARATKTATRTGVAARTHATFAQSLAAAIRSIATGSTLTT